MVKGRALYTIGLVVLTCFPAHGKTPPHNVPIFPATVRGECTLYTPQGQRLIPFSVSSKGKLGLISLDGKNGQYDDSYTIVLDNFTLPPPPRTRHSLIGIGTELPADYGLIKMYLEYNPPFTEPPCEPEDDPACVESNKERAEALANTNPNPLAGGVSKLGIDGQVLSFSAGDSTFGVNCQGRVFKE